MAQGDLSSFRNKIASTPPDPVPSTSGAQIGIDLAGLIKHLGLTKANVFKLKEAAELGYDISRIITKSEIDINNKVVAPTTTNPQLVDLKTPDTLDYTYVNFAVTLGTSRALDLVLLPPSGANGVIVQTDATSVKHVYTTGKAALFVPAGHTLEVQIFASNAGDGNMTLQWFRLARPAGLGLII